MKEHNICKLNLLQSGDLVCTDFVYETANGQEGPQKYEDYLLGLTVSGSGALLHGGKRYALCRGTVFAVGCGERFSVENEAALCYLYIRFHGRRAEELAARFGMEKVLYLTDVEERAVRFALEALQRANDSNLDLLTEATLLYVLAHIEAAARPQEELLQRMLALIHESFAEASFSLAELSHALGYDAKYLSFYFKKKKGVGFSAYLRELRIKRALFLMEQGVASVKNVAILSGFGDALYFSKIFKQEMGLSPKEYIERQQEGK